MSGDPRFGPNDIPSTRRDAEYVAWIDIMGIESVMAEHPKVAEINIGKFHLAVAEYNFSFTLELYPMADGVYGVSSDREQIFDFAANIMDRFSRNLITRTSRGNNSGELKFGPLIRCGISKGEVHHWSDLTETALADHDNRNALVTGNAISHAHACEERAPPLGIRLHDSASQCGDPSDYQWWEKENQGIFTREALGRYWKVYEEGCEIPYDSEARSRHAEKADNYFPSNRQIPRDYRLNQFYDEFDIAIDIPDDES